MSDFTIFIKDHVVKEGIKPLTCKEFLTDVDNLDIIEDMVFRGYDPVFMFKRLVSKAERLKIKLVDIETFNYEQELNQVYTKHKAILGFNNKG
jgi:hypothetical protein